VRRKRKKGGSRGLDWERLVVSFNVRWPSKEVYDSLTPTERKRAKLTALVDTLEGKENPLRLSRLTWANPEADHHPPTATKKSEILAKLPTLNRGNFLSNIASFDLERLGGRLEIAAQPPMERAKRAKQKASSARKAMAHIREKRYQPRHKKRIRSHRRVPRK
jgi:hypothetical protein